MSWRQGSIACDQWREGGDIDEGVRRHPNQRAVMVSRSAIKQIGKNGVHKWGVIVVIATKAMTNSKRIKKKQGELDTVAEILVTGFATEKNKRWLCSNWICTWSRRAKDDSTTAENRRWLQGEDDSLSRKEDLYLIEVRLLWYNKKFNVKEMILFVKVMYIYIEKFFLIMCSSCIYIMMINP